MITHNFTQTSVPVTDRSINPFPSRPFSGMGLAASICANLLDDLLKLRASSARRFRELSDERRTGLRRRPPWTVLVGSILLLVGCAQGDYRMPYEDGTIVEIINDHVTHDSPEAYMYDIVAQNASPAAIVAAAPGWVRFIDDSHQEPTQDNNYVWIEHPYPFCPIDANRADWPGKPNDYNSTCVPCDRDFCNEWTIYAHFVKDSVRVNAGLSEGDWVEASDFLGFEGDVGEATGVHLHWHVAVIPPDTVPDFNGYYLGYVNDTGKQPELIPIVCHQGGASVLWRTGTYTADDCPAEALLPGRSLLQKQPQARSPIAATIQRIARISDEAILIALADPALMRRAEQLLVRLEPEFQDLFHLGRARMSAAELDLVLDLLAEFETRGSNKMRRLLAPIRQQLQNPHGRRNLGLIVEDPFVGLR